MTDREVLTNFIRDGETKEQRLGLELEHFILNEVEEGIEFDVLSEMIRKTGEKLGAKLTKTDGHIVGYDAGDYTVSVEPACQFEISIAPFS